MREGNSKREGETKFIETYKIYPSIVTVLNISNVNIININDNKYKNKIFKMLFMCIL